RSRIAEDPSRSTKTPEIYGSGRRAGCGTACAPPPLMFEYRSGALVAAFAIVLGACGGSSDDDSSGQGAAQTSSSPLSLCAAVRGNGESILTHFASLAHITEHYGKIGGMAGGSSGSITTFTYESILKNPVVHSCGGSPCEADAEAG